jgi:hypothetical protein
VDTQHLHDMQQLLTRIDDFIRAALARTGNSSETPTDSLRGLIVSREEVEEYLGQAPLERPDHLASAPAPAALQLPEGLPFSRLAAAFRLTGLDAYILLLCLAAEFDRRYERFYAYLQDDVSERRPTVNLMMNLLGATRDERFAVWERLGAERPLRQYRLVECEAKGQQTSLLSQTLKVDPRVAAYLLGDERPDERLKHTVRVVEADAPASAANLEAVYRALPEVPMVYMQGKGSMGEAETAAALCAGYEMRLVRVDLPGLAALEGAFDLNWRLAVRGVSASGGAFAGWLGKLPE